MDTCTVMQYFIRLDSKIKLFTEICQKKHLNVDEIQQPFVVLVTQVTQDLFSYVKLWGRFSTLSRFNDENPFSVVPISQGTAQKYLTSFYVYLIFK